MPLTSEHIRFAHSEGHTDVCYFTGEKKGVLTCGSDGDVRVWLDIADDDPGSECVAEQCLCVLSKGEKIYVGNDSNTVQILNHPDFGKAGILSSFSSAVSALATNKKSNKIVCGSCDFRIRVVNVDDFKYTELNGHEAPILGLSLDPQEVFVASSSADGSIKIWNIEKSQAVHTFARVIPKNNSFFTAKVLGTPSFEPEEGKYLAYPHEKDIIVTERNTWAEAFRLKYPNLKDNFNICKFSECGTLLAASTLYGEIVVWSVSDQKVVGYIAHPNDTRITSLAWNPEKPNEIAFCDATGQLSSINVVVEGGTNFDLDFKDDIDDALSLPGDDDEDDDNVISISRIKADAEGDDRSSVSSVSLKKYEPALPRIELQEHFQPSSTPSHLLNHFMVWNDVGIVTFYGSEGDDSSSIEVEFHDTATHHSMRIGNYLNHTMAALSSQALVLSCPPNEENPSKVVVVVLQGWGSGNKEWTIDLPTDEESNCVAAGDNFIAVATSRNFLRIFTVSGVQREILAIPGQVVTMNAYKNQMIVIYHSGIGGEKDQMMEMMWIKINGRSIRNQTLKVPLSPGSKLRWVGLSDNFMPAVYDTDDILKVYNQKSSVWVIACDMKAQLAGQNDHYFIISISDGYARAIACKGTYYPVTSPRPFALSVPLSLPLCEPEDEKTKIELKICQLDQDSGEEAAALLELIALSCRKNVDYRVVDICQHFASQKVIELAIKYVARINRQSLVKKLQTIAETKYSQRLEEETRKEEEDAEMFDDFSKDNDKELNGDQFDLTPVSKKDSFELKPLPLINSRRSNPFIKTKASPRVGGLAALDSRVSVSPTVVKDDRVPKEIPVEKRKEPTKETFAMWFSKNRANLEAENPGMTVAELTKVALNMFKEKEVAKVPEKTNDEPESKKRKREDTDGTPKSASAKLANFIRKT